MNDEQRKKLQAQLDEANKKMRGALLFINDQGKVERVSEGQ